MLKKMLLVVSFMCIMVNIKAALLDEWDIIKAQSEFGYRVNHSVLYYDNKLWIIGGDDENAAQKNDVWYSVDGIDWVAATRNAEFPIRYGHSSVVFDNKMWVIGGITGSSTFYSDAWYSTDGIEWTAATRNAWGAGKRLHSSIVYDNKLWVIGGQLPGTPEGSVWYSTNGVDWNVATRNAEFQVVPYGGRFGHSSVVFDNKMWVIGGNSSGARNDAWYSTDGIEWTAATRNAQFVGRYMHGSVVLGGKIWVIAGTTGKGGLNDIWYSTNGVDWVQDTIGQFNSRYSLGLVANGDEIYLMAGAVGDTTYYTIYGDVQKSQLLPTPTFTYTFTATSTPTVTPTIEATYTIQEYKSIKYNAFLSDVLGNPEQSVALYEEASTAADSRNMLSEKAVELYNAAHVLVKQFRTVVGWNNAINYMMTTPTPNPTQKVIFQMTATPVMNLLSEADTYLDSANAIGTTSVTNKIEVDLNFIKAVQTFVAE